MLLCLVFDVRVNNIPARDCEEVTNDCLVVDELLHLAACRLGELGAGLVPPSAHDVAAKE